MENWLIEWFGKGSLTKGFYLLSTMTLPVWLLILLRPNSSIVQRLCRPFPVTSTYAIVLPLIVYQFYDRSILPKAPREVSYSSIQALTEHPMSFLMITATVILFNLFVGLSIFRDASSTGSGARGAILASAVFAPLGICLYTAQLIWSRMSKLS